MQMQMKVSSSADAEEDRAYVLMGMRGGATGRDHWSSPVARQGIMGSGALRTVLIGLRPMRTPQTGRTRGPRGKGL